MILHQVSSFNRLVADEAEEIYQQAQIALSLADELYRQIYNIQRRFFQVTSGLSSVGIWGRQLPIPPTAKERITQLQRLRSSAMGKYKRLMARLRWDGRKYVLTSHSNPLSLYQAFHGNPPARTRRVNLPVPKQGDRLIKIGRLYSVIYTPERPSQHYGKLFEHKLGDTGDRMLRNKPILATDSQGKNLYIIPDRASPKFTKRGIIG